MNFTLFEALELNCMVGTKVIAGHAGLDREIRYVNVMEVPDIANWISKDELLLTTGYAFREAPATFAELIVKLSEKGLTGFAIKPHRFLEKIPDEVIDVAEKLNLPILELPPHAQFDKIIREILTEVINRDYQQIVKSEQIHKTFTKLVLSGGGLNDIAASLSRLCHAQVKIFDSSSKSVANSEANMIKTDETNAVDRFSVNVYINEQVEAHIEILKNIAVTKEDIIAVERAADLVAMILFKNRVAQEVDKGYRNDFLNDLISGEIESKEVVIQRGKYFGMHLAVSYALFLIDVDSFEEIFLQTLDELKSHALLDKLYRFVSHYCFGLSKNSIVWERSDSIMVLYPVCEIRNEFFLGKKQPMIFNMAEQIKDAIDKNIKEFTVSIGIGSYQSDIMNINQSYLEAHNALKIGKTVWGKNRVYSHDKLGIYKLLAQFPNKQELMDFARMQLAAMLDYDLKKRTNLIETLELLLDNNVNIKVTAEKMFIHPKTMTYRKQRIEELLKQPLQNSESVLSVYLALKILRMDDSVKNK